MQIEIRLGDRRWHLDDVMVPRYQDKIWLPVDKGDGIRQWIKVLVTSCEVDYHQNVVYVDVGIMNVNFDPSWLALTFEVEL